MMFFAAISILIACVVPIEKFLQRFMPSRQRSLRWTVVVIVFGNRYAEWWLDRHWEGNSLRCCLVPSQWSPLSLFNLDLHAWLKQVEVVEDSLKFCNSLNFLLQQVLKLGSLLPGQIATILPLLLINPELFCLLHPVVTLSPSVCVLVYGQAFMIGGVHVDCHVRWLAGRDWSEMRHVSSKLRSQWSCLGAAHIEGKLNFLRLLQLFNIYCRIGGVSIHNLS